jgi:microcystin-dependent protein
MPLGSIIMWAYNVIPDGWHICDGTVLSGNEYSDFINTLGPTLPDLRARFVVGINNNQGQTSVISSES